MAKKNEPAIAPDQLERMLKRYAATIAAHFACMGETHGDRELELARNMIEAATMNLKERDQASAQHLTGFVQGVLLCKGLVSWEYLAEDDRRI